LQQTGIAPIIELHRYGRSDHGRNAEGHVQAIADRTIMLVDRLEPEGDLEFKIEVAA
jgi:hypothetical protein